MKKIKFDTSKKDIYDFTDEEIEGRNEIIKKNYEDIMKVLMLKRGITNDTIQDVFLKLLNLSLSDITVFFGEINWQAYVWKMACNIQVFNDTTNMVVANNMNNHVDVFSITELKGYENYESYDNLKREFNKLKKINVVEEEYNNNK